MEEKNNKSKKWYQNTFVIILSLIFLYPLGLLFLWLSTNWDKTLKWILTVIFGILFLFIFMANSSKPNSSDSSSTSQATTSSVTPTSKPVKKLNIVVTSMIVKKVAPTTYRYFFNVADNASEDFKGSVFVQLFNAHDTPEALIFGGATKSFSDSPVPAGANSVIYVDDSHAPNQVDGIDGATTFTYSVSVDDQEVASGKDDISNQYEDDLNLNSGY